MKQLVDEAPATLWRSAKSSAQQAGAAVRDVREAVKVPLPYSKERRARAHGAICLLLVVHIRCEEMLYYAEVVSMF
jgi:hypothetical protein